MTDSMKQMLMNLYVEKYGHHISEDMAKELVHDFPVTDGSGRESGEKWNCEQAKDLALKVGIDLDKINKWEWYLVLNNMYSDYSNTLKKHGMTDSTIYAELAKDWFHDPDADEHKTFKYFIS